MVESFTQNSGSGMSMETGTGGVVRPLYSERIMKCYTVTEEELSTVSMLNAQSTTWFSVGAFLASLGIGFLSDGYFAESLKPSGQALHEAGSWICIVLALVFFLLGFYARKIRSGVIDKIKNESSHE